MIPLIAGEVLADLFLELFTGFDHRNGPMGDHRNGPMGVQATSFSITKPG